MSLDLSKSLQASYDHATMRKLAERMKSTPDWKAVQDVQKRHDLARKSETESYRRDFDARVAAERHSLLRKRGQPVLEPKKPVALDRFNKTTLDRQVRRNVQFEHHRTMASIDASETKALETLTERAGIKPERGVKSEFARTQSQAPRHRHKQKM